MSADFRPIDHIVWNCGLKAEGTIDRFLMETPYLEMVTEVNGEKKRIPINDKECCDRFPYVAFFGEEIGKVFQENKNDPVFLERMALMEKTLREITEKVYEQCQKSAAAGSRRISLNGVFDNIPKEFPYLEDFILAQNKYAFHYDSSSCYHRFFKDFMGIPHEEDREWDDDER